MSESIIEGVPSRKDPNGNRLSKKSTSHGTYRCKRRPSSKRCG